MPNPPAPLYQVGRLPQVDETLRALSERAAQLGIHKEYITSLKVILQKLRIEPLVWGDPAYQTHRQGGVVCHAIHAPLIVNYVTFEPEKVVCILKVRPLPGHALEGGSPSGDA